MVVASLSLHSGLGLSHVFLLNIYDPTRRCYFVFDACYMALHGISWDTDVTVRFIGNHTGSASRMGLGSDMGRVVVRDLPIAE